jgi:hypothetical protein
MEEVIFSETLETTYKTTHKASFFRAVYGGYSLKMEKINSSETLLTTHVTERR